MKIKTTQKGFMLMELLVVIAIIGLLSSVVLAALYSAKVKSADAAVKTELRQIPAQIETSSYSPNGAVNYGPVYTASNCPTTSSTTNPIFYTNTGLQQMISNIDKLNGSAASVCASGGTDPAKATSWAIATPLPSTGSSGDWLCIDSTGARKVLPAAGAGGGAPFGGGQFAAFNYLLRSVTPLAIATVTLNPVIQCLNYDQCGYPTVLVNELSSIGGGTVGSGGTVAKCP